MEKSNALAKGPKPAHPIPARSRQASIPDLVDLGAYYTTSLDDDWLVKPGANLASLPKGVQGFARACFDVRGLIQLAGKKADEATGISFPKSITGIKIGAKVRTLHFLQGASWSADVDTKIGEYVLHYADGKTATVPIVYGRSVVDWWVNADSIVPTDAKIAWTGENEASHKLEYEIQLYTYTVNNPRPGGEIATIDFVSTGSDSAPFLVAMTYEPVKTDYEWFDAIKIWNGIVPRSRQALADLVDLGAYFNTSLDDNWFNHAGHNFQEVPKGVQVLDGTAFELRGIIQLAGTRSLKISGVALPEAVKGIKVGRKGTKIHFLHACGFSSPTGTQIGQYVIHYANGQTRSVPILYGKNVLDWWGRSTDVKLTEGKEVWKGNCPSPASMGFYVHLVRYTWDNPLPEEEIAEIDFVSDLAEAAPQLMAITVEPAQKLYEKWQMVKVEHAIPPRDKNATPGMVDLTPFYTYSLDDWLHGKTENHLKELPHGIFEAGGVKFDTRGVIQLTGTISLFMTGTVYPEQVSDIAVNRKGRKIHFLQAAAWGPEDGNNLIGEYTLHYANGEQKVIPITYGDNVADWWVRPKDVPMKLPHASIAWEGSNPKTKGQGFSLRLYKYTVENPLPDVEIAYMDFKSKIVQSAPILVAVTVE
jgi:hypothetical protein